MATPTDTPISAAPPTQQHPVAEVDVAASRNSDVCPDTLINHADAISYWQGIDADVNGMLGGFPYISRVDLQGSRNFLAKCGLVHRKTAVRSGLRSKESEADVQSSRLARVVDCGAGIGRITEGLLLSIAQTVDIVEPVAKFSEKLVGKEGVGEIFNIGLEKWTPSYGEGYDLIWNQWCLGHLTDLQLVEYLRRCANGLKAGNGWIVVKENLSTSGKDIFDDVDSSVTRTDEKFRKLFEEAGLKLKRTEIQNGLPKELFPVRMYALQPTT